MCTTQHNTNKQTTEHLIKTGHGGVYHYYLTGDVKDKLMTVELKTVKIFCDAFAVAVKMHKFSKVDELASQEYLRESCEEVFKGTIEKSAIFSATGKPLDISKGHGTDCLVIVVESRLKGHAINKRFTPSFENAMSADVWAKFKDNAEQGRDILEGYTKTALELA